jgi:translation elongation factor EF-1alpha
MIEHFIILNILLHPLCITFYINNFYLFANLRTSLYLTLKNTLCMTKAQRHHHNFEFSKGIEIICKAKLEPSKPMFVEDYKSYPPLGRFAFRDRDKPSLWLWRGSSLSCVAADVSGKTTKSAKKADAK